MTEKVLNYDRSIVPQETGWWCGPASTQIVLNAMGIKLKESWIAEQIEQIENPGRGDDYDGTDYIGEIQTFLKQLPQTKHIPWTVVNMTTDPPTVAQKEKLWRDIKRSVDAGVPVIANIVSPPNNKPAATRGSKPPPYPRGIYTWHYFTLPGYYEDDNPANRAVWVGDPASFGGITGWWCPFDGPGSICSLIPPKGYCFADMDPVSPPVVTTTPPPVVTTTAPDFEAALKALLEVIEKYNPEILRAYLAVMKGR